MSKKKKKNPEADQDDQQDQVGDLADPVFPPRGASDQDKGIKHLHDDPNADDIEHMADNTPIARRCIEDHRRCPICWGGFSGVGNCYSTRRKKRYYKCCRCGHTWSVQFKIDAVQVESRIVKSDNREPPEVDHR